MIIKPILKNINPITKIGKIYLRVDLYDSLNSKRQQVFFKTEFEAKGNEFKKGRLLGNSTYSKNINDLLYDEVFRLKKNILDLQSRGVNINKSSLSKMRGESKKIEKSLLEYLGELKQKYVSSNQIPVSIKIQTLINHFQNFSKSAVYYSASINQKFLDDFANYLTIVCCLHPNTVHRHFKILKLLFNFLKDHYHLDIPRLKFPKQVPTEKAFLSKDEIQKIFEYQPKTKKEEKVKKLMIIGIYTGLRYSDLKRLNKSHIVGNVIKMKMQKVNTDEYLMIPISERLGSVLASIDYDVSKIMMSNQKFNDYISDLCEYAKIDSLVEKTVYRKGTRSFIKVPKYKLISAHNLRNTFVSIAIQSKMDLNMIMKITGHKKISTLQVYAKQVEDYVSEDYKLFSNFLK